MKLILVKVSKLPPDYTGDILLPMSNDLSGIPHGEIMADLRKNRNVKNHRRFFAFIKMSFDMQDTYETIDIWRRVLQMKAGHFDEVVTEKGKLLYLPKSIAWDELDEIEFRPLFTEIVNAFIRDFGHNLNDLQINSVVEF